LITITIGFACDGNVVNVAKITTATLKLQLLRSLTRNAGSASPGLLTNTGLIQGD